MPIKLSIVKDYEELSRSAARIVSDHVKKKPTLVLGLITGETPIGCYRELIRMHREKGLDFSKVTTFNVDEYLGLPPTHPQSYRYFMNKNLFNHVNIRMEKTHIPDGASEDPRKACEDFEKLIKASGGIDLQLLGIGVNGHIAFNEPGSPFDSRTRVVNLSEETIKANARFFSSIDEVPRQAISMGIGTILEARKIILLASGERKAEAVAKSIEGPVTTECPASALQMHPDCTFIIDKAAASKLRRCDWEMIPSH